MTETSLWWLSFVDPDKSAPPDEQVPGGGGFLGVAIVEADGPGAAITAAWEHGCNPGGQVGIVGPAPIDTWPVEMWNRLLTAEEAQAL